MKEKLFTLLHEVNLFDEYAERVMCDYASIDEFLNKIHYSEWISSAFWWKSSDNRLKWPIVDLKWQEAISTRV